jgi:hypothetical protein
MLPDLSDAVVTLIALLRRPPPSYSFSLNYAVTCLMKRCWSPPALTAGTRLARPREAGRYIYRSERSDIPLIVH